MVQASELGEALRAFQRGDLERARKLAEAELESGPPAQTNHLLGLIHCRLGDPATGIGHLRAAVQAEPDNVGYRVMLVRALVDGGQPVEAIAAAGTPAGTSPAELALWHARAEAADSAGEAAAALEAWGRLCDAGIPDWRAWANFGNALASAERWADALAAFRGALRLAPSQPGLRRSVATSLAQLGRDDEAADELTKWVEDAPDDPENRVLLARLLADLGRDSESIAQLDRVAMTASGTRFDECGDGMLALARGADGEIRETLLLELARLLERTGRTASLRRLLDDAEAEGIARERFAYPAAAIALQDGNAPEARRLLQSDRSPADPQRWHWLMARIADQLGEPAEAFAEAEAMNRTVARRDHWLGACLAHVAWARQAAKAMTSARAAKLRPLEPGARPAPVFLVGFPRSGTTLLDTFLMGHPDAVVLEEIPLLRHAQQALGESIDLARASRDDLARARDAYFQALDRHLGAAPRATVIDKLPLNMLGVELIHMLFPDARLIFAQRHPCDCVLSCFMQAFALNDSMACFLDLERAADFYDAAMTLWARNCEMLPLQVHRLVYEDLVEDPEAALRPLVDFLGLEWSDGLLDHRATARARGSINTPSYDQVVKPISRQASGRWRRYREQLEPVLPVLLPWAERLGYPA